MAVAVWRDCTDAVFKESPWLALVPLLGPWIGAIAQATTTLQIGTAVLLVAERDPIITPKEVASVDVLSGGRMNFGVGPGWINQEMRNHGTDPDYRWKVMRERVEAMRQIWTHDIASYHGDHVSFDRITSWPKPLQEPHPPILVAGNGPNVAKRVIAYGDECIPMLRSHVGGPDRLSRRWRRVAPPLRRA